VRGRASENQRILGCDIQNVVLVSNQSWFEDQVRSLRVKVCSVDNKLASGGGVDNLVGLFHGWGWDDHGNIFSRTQLIHAFDLQFNKPQWDTFHCGLVKPPEVESKRFSFKAARHIDFRERMQRKVSTNSIYLFHSLFSSVEDQTKHDVIRNVDCVRGWIYLGGKSALDVRRHETLGDTLSSDKTRIIHLKGYYLDYLVAIHFWAGWQLTEKERFRTER
jgi:hypothetical protein